MTGRSRSEFRILPRNKPRAPPGRRRGAPARAGCCFPGGGQLLSMSWGGASRAATSVPNPYTRGRAFYLIQRPQARPDRAMAERECRYSKAIINAPSAGAWDPRSASPSASGFRTMSDGIQPRPSGGSDAFAVERRIRSARKRSTSERARDPKILRMRISGSGKGRGPAGSAAAQGQRLRAFAPPRAAGTGRRDLLEEGRSLTQPGHGAARAGPAPRASQPRRSRRQSRPGDMTASAISRRIQAPTTVNSMAVSMADGRRRWRHASCEALDRSPRLILPVPPMALGPTQTRNDVLVRIDVENAVIERQRGLEVLRDDLAPGSRRSPAGNRRLAPGDEIIRADGPRLHARQPDRRERFAGGEKRGQSKRRSGAEDFPHIATREIAISHEYRRVPPARSCRDRSARKARAAVSEAAR